MMILFSLYFVAMTLLTVLNMLMKKRRLQLNVLQNNGIPCSEPSLISGNLNEALSMPNVLFDDLMTKRHGPICGYYLGTKPVVLITHPELIKQVLFTRRDIFRERPRKVPGGINPDPKRALMLGNLPFPKWKIMRATVSKAFAAQNLNNVQSKVADLIEVMERKIESTLRDSNSQDIDMYEISKGLALDIIGHTGFGLKTNVQLDTKNDKFLKAVQSEFSKKTNSILIRLYLCFPEISWIIYPIRRVIQFLKERLNLCPSLPLWQQGFTALSNTGRDEHESTDLLGQLLIANPPLTPIDIVANSVLFFEAGYETTASILGILIHLIVNHPSVQARLREELKANIWRETKEFKYMTAVIYEALRMYPPQTTFIGRSPIEDCELRLEGKAYIIPKGCHVQIGIVQVQNSPDYWEDPERFKPERFLRGSGNMTFKWLPFGEGPKRCLGRTFAMNNLKMVLQSIFSQYWLTRSPLTEEKITMEYKLATMTPKYGSFVTVNHLPL